MGGTALSGKRVSLEVGIEVAGKALELLRGTYERSMVCGSIRRGKAEVGDVDIVLEVPPNLEAAMEARLVELCGRQQNGKPKKKFLIDGVQVDLYLATTQDWGTQVLMWTGSKTFNIQCRSTANALGFMLNQYGLWDGEERLAGADEEGVFDKLGMKYTAPKERD